MKIALLCSSLAPGRDGVGDYTRQLAAACTARGHTCLLVSLRDPHPGNADEADTLRLPADQPPGVRLARLERTLAAFSPDQVSWQFVGYGYHPKGLVGAETRAFARVLAPRRPQVMLHELWIGIDRHEPWRNRLVGALQRRGLLGLLAALHPASVATTNDTYRAVLARAGVDATVLPLFGNIPVADPVVAPLARYLPAGPRTTWLVGATFGTLHPQWQPGAAAEFMSATARRFGRRPVLLAAGRTGPHGAGILEHLRARGVATVTTGELPAADISRLFQGADFGLAPHPWALIGKSGAAAALLDHGLPVLVPRDDWSPRFPLPSSATASGRLARLADLTPERAATWLDLRCPPAPALDGVADAFLAALSHRPVPAEPVLASPRT